MLVLTAALSSSPADAAERVRVTTNMGEFVIEVQPDRAPLTVANFLRYVREGFYSGTVFHRVVGGFVIQGGGHTAGDYKLKPTHEPVVNESGNGLQNLRGTVGLARTAGAHTGNSQFYINLVDNPELDPVPTRWGYAVFGRVVEGMDVIDRIGVVATGAVGPFKSDAPLQPVIIEKVVIEGESAPPAPAPAKPSATEPSSSAAPSSGVESSGTDAQQ